MDREKRVLAFDFGASGGRAILGTFNGKTIYLKEVHRFSNDPVFVQGTLYWDVLRLFHEIKQGLVKAKLLGRIDSIGVDTWGVDFGLLDPAGRLLENPVHYRDQRTAGMLEEAFRKLDPKEFYDRTGNQFMEINTAFQLLSLAEHRPELLERAQTMLLMPDLFNYLLCGSKKTEYSIGSTTQLLEAKERCWSTKVIQSLGIPQHIFTEIIPPGTPLGPVSSELAEELGLAERPTVIAVAGHDTQCAMAAVPSRSEDFIFLSCGTWSLLGTELSAPLISEKSSQYNITNEGAYGGRASFLKNIIGLWLIQESRRQWIREGREYSFSVLEEMARAATPLQSFIDPDAPEFVPAGNIPERIREYCRRTGQAVPENEGAIVRCIDESLALKYRHVLTQIEDCTAREYSSNIHMVGGGTQSSLLCQLTANACQRRVKAGPVEATVMGNIVLQLLAAGELKNLQEARQVIADSEVISVFTPKQPEVWSDAYQKWKDLVLC